MVEETNALRNVIMRSEVFPDSIKAGYRSDLKEYLEIRISYFDHLEDFNTILNAKERFIELYKSLWNRTVQASTLPNMGMPTTNMFNTLSVLMDNASKRDAMLLAGIPEPILYMLFFLALTISFIGGFTTPFMKIKEWLVILGFALLATCIIFISLDLGRPLRGIIKPDLGETRLLEIKKILNETTP
jgi:hypothetical protein